MNIDEFSYHEVLDRASILADSWEDQITHHSAVIAERLMGKEAEKISDLLHKFYQDWGSVYAAKRDFGKKQSLVPVVAEKLFFHNVYKDPIIGGLLVGSCGSLKYILNKETQVPLTTGYHSFYMDKGILMGELGATVSKVVCK